MFYIINNESMKQDSRIRVQKLKAARRVVKDTVQVVEKDQIPVTARAIPFTYYYKGNRVSAVYATEPIKVKPDRLLCKEAYHVRKGRKVIKENLHTTKTKDGAMFEGFIIFKI
jgi:hypothetical protein